MSHGHGWIQRKILEGLEDDVWCHLLDMVCYVFDTKTPTNAQYKSVARAVSKLEEEGYLSSAIYIWDHSLVWILWENNEVKTPQKYYPSRKHYPKWSKQIWRIR